MTDTYSLRPAAFALAIPDEQGRTRYAQLGSRLEWQATR